MNLTTGTVISQLPTGTIDNLQAVFPLSIGMPSAPQTIQLSLQQLQDQFGNAYQPSGTVGMALLNAGTLTSSTGSIVIPSIAQAYRALELHISARTDRAATSDGIDYKINNDSGQKYFSYVLWHNFDSQSNDQAAAQATPSTIAYATAAQAPTNEFGSYVVTIPFYTQPKRKFFQAIGGQVIGTGTTSIFIYQGAGSVNLLDAISRIDLTPNLGMNFVSGTSWALYGLR